MTTRRLKMSDVFDMTSFIFKYLANNITDFDLWTNDEAEYMDLEYLTRWAGEKPLSQLTINFVDEDGEISTADMQKLARLVYEKYKRNWEQYKKYLDANYDVWDDVENETRSYSLTDNQKPNNWKTISSGDAADNETEVSSETYGFNDPAGVPQDKATTKQKSKITTEQLGNYQTDHRYSENVFKKGSSKLRTGAEMMEMDEKFWTRWDYIDAIFRDVDKVLTGNFYYSEYYLL